MRKILLTTSFIFLLFNLVLGQNNCSTPYLFETGNSYTYILDTNVVNQDTLIDYGCMTVQQNPLWLYFGVCNTGNISIKIQLSSSASDVDFIVWGPLTDSNDCNLSASQIVACDYGAPSTNNISLTNLQYGYYKILITNPTNAYDSIIINQMAGSVIACPVSSCFGGAPHGICKVSTDNSINENVIDWIGHSGFFGDYNLQKETTVTGVYSTIATIPYNGILTYIDTLSNPVQQSYKYRLESIDTCGIIKVSAYHQTIHLITSVNPVTNYPQLSWNPYTGFNYSTYYIYRGTSPTTVLLYDSMSTSFTTYTDVNPLAGSLYYAIGVNLPSACTYLGSLKTGTESSFSNISPVTLTSVDEYNKIGLSLYPNPVKDNLTISFGNKSVTAEMILLDVFGRVVMTKNYNNTFNDEIDISNLTKGYYVIQLFSNKGSTRMTFIKN